ncbi:hypothetical protein CISG_04113 [Coccidioides immitis RMSCC 3703]|uniref:Uncharacterized protein n=1 Tax=Coccidioides immitis RMSCC 3703 TaxID=454286 RepID=A0A0J8QT09_COCIT|nr:hypothetical protein CISG_04113 [Coccidioides immitis RMSCC 3703]
MKTSKQLFGAPIRGATSTVKSDRASSSSSFSQPALPPLDIRTLLRHPHTGRSASYRIAGQPAGHEVAGREISRTPASSSPSGVKPATREPYRGGVSRRDSGAAESTAIWGGKIDKGPKFVARARSKELEEAQQIASQLDDLLVSPPFSDSYELLRLRGMVSLWIGDLCVSSVSPDEAAEQGVQMGGDEDGDITMMSYDDRVDSILARMEEGLGMERRQAEVDKAKEFFERARARKVGPLSAADKVYMDSIDSY